MMQSPPTSECPNVMSLTMYVSGSLVEAAANELSEHLEQCGRCRHLVDEMATEPDSLINAIRRSPEKTPGADSGLDKLIIGELALDGKVRPVTGALPVALHARDSGIATVIVPLENAEEAGVVDGIRVIGVKSLRDTIEFLDGRLAIQPGFRDR